MILILKRIKEDINVLDIEAFLEPALEGGFLKSAGRIKNLQIIKLLSSGSKKAECHALVKVDPDSVAKRVIKQLNRKPCKGKPINVVRYFARDFNNDLRRSRYQIAHNRRVADRRRTDLKIIDITLESRWQRLGPDPDINWY
jgi:hypothetical protein